MERRLVLEQLGAHRPVDLVVLRRIHRTRSSQNTDRTAVRIQYRGLGGTAATGVKLREVTSREQPETEVRITHVLDILEVQDGLVGDGVITAVTGVVEEEHTALEQVLHAVLGQRITLAVGIHLLRVGIQENLMNHEVRVRQTNHLGTYLRCLGMRAAFSVVRQIHQLRLPLARLLIVHITNEFVYYLASFGKVVYRQTTYADLHRAGVVVLALFILEKTEIVIGRIGVHLIHGVLCLVGQQERSTRVGQQLAVVERTVTHEQ